jgi:hypothetical protein
MRVFSNNDGSELVFTLYRRPDVSDQESAEDAKSVEKDLAKLKTLLEKCPRINRNPCPLKSPMPWIGRLRNATGQHFCRRSGEQRDWKIFE